MVDTIKDGVVVTMAYRMEADGEEIEHATADDPLPYLHGAGKYVEDADNIVPGLEAALAGKTVGDKIRVTLAPDAAYGERDPEAIQTGDINDFDLPDSVGVGDEVEVEDDKGSIYFATIADMDDETLTLDLNNPLAGKTITFEVEVLALREATDEEIEYGEPIEFVSLDDHDDDHDH